MAIINKILVIAIMAIALVALTGAANALTPTITVKVDKVQVNGFYRGTPKLLSSDTQIFGYEYTIFVPDGTYTVFGTITNNGNEPASVWVGAGTEAECEVSDTFNVPKKGKTSFTFSFRAADNDDVTVGYELPGSEGIDFVNLDGVEFVNGPDNMVHTVDQGPMSDAVVIFTNGVPSYNGKPIYSVSLGQ